jgi:regulator of protease activity HflC (stomatin/prohibitin superfamily)
MASDLAYSGGGHDARQERRGFFGWLRSQRRNAMLVLLVAMFIVAATAPRIFITIPSGHAGVLWMRLFGGTRIAGGALGEGLHIIFPWDKIFIYDVRMKEHSRDFEVISSDALHMKIQISFRWRLILRNLPRLHQEMGPEYLNSLLVPDIGSVVRERISKRTAEELFERRRAEIQADIYNNVVSDDQPNSIGPVNDKGENGNLIALVDILIQTINLPDKLRNAIERKFEESQFAQEYNYRLARERLESERKQIEASGIQAFQQTVNQGISENYLRWRGIEATLQLSASPNAKIVVIGGQNGLPLILNTGEGTGPGGVGSGPRATAPSLSDLGRIPDGGTSAANAPGRSPYIAAFPPYSRFGGAADPATAPPAPADPRAAAAATVDLLRRLGQSLGYRLEPATPGSPPPETVPAANQPR